MRRARIVVRNSKESVKKGDVVWSLEEKREIAKLGMAGSMVATVASTLFWRDRGMRKLHVGAGVALVGFSLWHHFLYQSKGEEKGEVKESKRSKAKATLALPKP